MVTSKNKKRVSSKALNQMTQRLFFFGAFLFGLSLFVYPMISQEVNDYFDQKFVQMYQKKASKKNQEEIRKIQLEMSKHDKKVRGEKNPGSDGEPFSEEVRQKDKKTTPTPNYVEKHTAGIIVIPKIHVKLPIFDKTNDYFLSKGAALLEGTSSLLGGENLHAVISSHRGLKTAKLFTDLPKLKEKDIFYLELAADTHAYEVDQIKVIEPTETKDLLIVDGKDYVTLMTCTPYGINSHRLLVRGHRIPYTKEMEEVKSVVDQRKRQHQLLVLLVVIVGIFLLILVITGIVRAGLIGRRTYLLTFYLVDFRKQQPLVGQRVYLTGKKGKNLVKIDGKTVSAVSDEQGKVDFKEIYGKVYGLAFENQSTIFAKTKVKKIKDANFSLKAKSQGVVIKQLKKIYVLGDFFYEELGKK